jgi:acetoin utilization deacetylase AcuC-like enzyme
MRIVYSEKHFLHAPVEEVDGKAGLFRPHPEVPQRASGILECLREQQLGEIMQPRPNALEVLTAVHDRGLIDFYRRVLPAWQARTGRPGPVLPDFLVVSLGVDTVQGDPVGGLQLPVGSFPGLGAMIGSTALPVLVVQEGGYSLRLAGPCVAGFLTGLSEGRQRSPGRPR